MLGVLLRLLLKIWVCKNLVIIFVDLISMALFDDFLVLWNRADSEELQQIVNHVLEYVNLQEHVEFERQDEAAMLFDKEVSKLASVFGCVSFPNSKVVHVVQFALPCFTYCGRRIPDGSSFKHDWDGVLCRVCEKRYSWVVDHDLYIAEQVVTFAKGYVYEKFIREDYEI